MRAVWGAGAVEGADVGVLTILDLKDVDTRVVHGYGKLAAPEEGMKYIAETHTLIHWKVHHGVLTLPLGVKGAGGALGEAPAPDV